MNREQLYEYLDIDTPADFEYFENMAALLECEEDIHYEEVCALIEDVDKDNLAMLIDNYFEELSDFYPDGDDEFYMLMDKIRLSLSGMAKNSGEKNTMASLAEELCRFRKWYSLESEVVCVSVSEGAERTETLRDALVLSRLEKLNGEKFYYDLSSCKEYEIDDYMMSFADVIAACEEDGETPQ